MSEEEASETIRPMFVAGQQFREVKQDFFELLKKILGDKYEDDLQKDLIEEPWGNQISPERFSDVCLRTQCRRAIRNYTPTSMLTIVLKNELFHVNNQLETL